MFKRIISMLAAMSILCSITAAFANNTDTAVGTDIISTDGFTEDNVIYNALKDTDGGAALYSAGSDVESEGIICLLMSTRIAKPRQYVQVNQIIKEACILYL